MDFYRVITDRKQDFLVCHSNSRRMHEFMNREHPPEAELHLNHRITICAFSCQRHNITELK